MKKSIKIFSLLILFMCCFCMVKVKAVETFPNKITSLIGWELTYSKAKVVYKILDDKSTESYCVESGKDAPNAVCSLMDDQYSEGQSAGIAAIIDSVEDGKQKQYYYASLALHLYTEPDYSDWTEEDMPIVQPYLDKAKAAENSVNGFNITVKADSNEFSRVGDYFVSPVVSVTAAYGDGYSVTLSTDDAEVINKTDSSFQIRVPASSIKTGSSLNVTATVKTTQTYKLAARYDCGSTVQKVVPDILKSKTREKTAAISFTATVEQPKISITKSDKNNNPLSGATLQLFDSNGNELKDSNGKVIKWVSTKAPYYIEGLQAGSYILREIEAPVGYELLNKDIVFEVSSDGIVTIKEKITEAEVKNSGLIVFNSSKTKLLISKQDITNNKELPGATLQILDSEGNEIIDEEGNVLYKWESTTEPHYIEGLPAGKYILVEVTSPDGYVLNEERIEFELKNDGVVVPVIMKNTPIVDVPATGFNTSLFILSIGMIAIISGTIVIGLNVKRQTQ